MLAGAMLLGGAGCAGPGDDGGAGRLFGGRDLAGWQVLRDGFFTGAGKVDVQAGCVVLEAGDALTGIRWAGAFPTDNYEVTLDAMRVEGGDFFCGMTFPAAGGSGTLILGGWGGSVVGISNVDGLAASENETARMIEFQQGRWYRVRLLVTAGRLAVWIDDEKTIDMKTAGRKLDVWPQQEDARPFGITTWRTTGALRNIRLRRLGESSEAPPRSAS